MMPTTRNRTIAFTVAAMLLPLGVLLLLEAGFRLLTPFPAGTMGTYEVNDDFLYFHKPGSKGHEVNARGEFAPVKLRYNALGFRGDDIPSGRTPGVLRIVVLGDSFVEARQVREEATAAALLASLLPPGLKPANAKDANAKAAKTEDVNTKAAKAEVVNAGCSAYTTTTAYLLLKHRILPLRPDVVFYLFAYNDYYDNFVYGNYSAYPAIFDERPDPKLRPTAYMSAPDKPLTTRIVEHSALLSYFAALFGPRPDLTVRPYPMMDETAFHKNWALINKPDLDADERHVLDFTHEGLRRMDEACRRAGTTFVVLVLPLPMQVAPHEWAGGKAGLGYLPHQTMDATTYQERIVRFCNDKGIQVVDLLPAFRRVSTAASPLFYEYEGHMTEAGQAAFARVMAEYITATAGR